MELPAEVKQILNQDSYQVMLLSCKSNLPFGFFRHPWFVINKNGKLSRWEVLIEKNRHKTGCKHLYKDNFPPFTGIGYLPLVYIYLKKSKLEGYISGDKNSVAKQIIEFIENSPNTYRFCNDYWLTGPNSNTYAQWVLDNFLGFKVKLPKYSVGKNYLRKVSPESQKPGTLNN